MCIRAETLDWWFKTNKNVMLSGKHGVGKTAMIKSCFERNGLVHNETYLYFSASTLDPWVDLIGCPKETSDELGNKYLDIIRPKNLYKGKIVAIFFDEFNRSPKKVRNAVMELLQFKSINGFRFPDLKCVWTAINPEDNDSYDVEKVDPAQQDRFHIIKEIPYACDSEFFAKKFGAENAIAAIEWWDALPEKERNLVSPRRLEYALDEFCINGNLRDILPASTNVSKLLNALNVGSIQSKINSLYESKNIAESKLFLSDENNVNSAISYISEKDEYMTFFLPFIAKEKTVSFLSSSDVIFNHVSKEYKSNPVYFKMFQEILLGTNKSLKQKITNIFSKQQKDAINRMEESKENESESKKVEFFKISNHNSAWRFDKVMARLSVVDFNVIEDKAMALKTLTDNLTSEMDGYTCECFIGFISRVICNSSKQTLLSNDFINIIPILNSLIILKLKNSFIDIDHFWTHSFKPLAYRLKDLGFFDRVFTGENYIKNIDKVIGDQPNG